MINLRNPFESLLSLQEAMERAMGFDLFGSSTMGRDGFPSVNMFEDKDHHLIVKAEIPGVQKNSIDIEVKGDVLRIQGERKPDYQSSEVNVHRMERDFMSFSRALKLPYRPDESKILARYEDGILTIELQQHEKDKPHKISIN